MRDERTRRRAPRVEGRFFVTPHAVDRYREHFVPGLRYEAARDELIRIASAGQYVEPYRGLEVMGSLELWRGPIIGTRARQDRRSRLRFVVGHGGKGTLPQVVTVLAGRKHGARRE